MSGNANVNRQASNFGTKFAPLALSFHLTQQFQEKAKPCGHRPRGREESNHARKSVRLAARPKDRVVTNEARSIDSEILGSNYVAIHP